MGHARSRHHVGGLVDLLQEVRVILRFSGYLTDPFSADEIVFEDHDLFGFVWVAPTVKDLIKGWEVHHDNFISRRAGALRKAADKAWNLYAIFLTRDKPTEIERGTLSKIEEDFRGSRKIASSDLNTPEQVIRALYPLSSIRNVVRLEAEVAPKEDPIRRLCLTSIFRDELITAFSTDLTETSRAEFVYQGIGSVGLEQVEKRATDMKAALDKLIERDRQAYESARTRISDLTAAISELRATAAPAQGHSLDAATRMLADLVKKDVEDLATLVSQAHTALIDAQRRLSRLERLQMDLSNSARQIAEMALIQQQCDQLGAQLERLKSELEMSTQRRNELTAKIELERKKTPNLASLAQIREHGERLGLQDGRCSLCGSTVSSNDYATHLKQIREEIDRHNSALRDLARQEGDWADKDTNLKNRYETARAENSRILSDLEAIRRSNARLNNEAAELGTPLEKESIAASIQQTRDEARDLDSALRELEGFFALNKITDLEKERLAVQRNNDEIAERILVLEAARRSAETASAEARRLSTEVLEDRLAQLEPLLVELYLRFKPHVDYAEVKYKMRGQIRRFLRLEIGEDINPRFLFSSGQRRALGLAFLLAVYLSRPWCKLRTLILDDPVQHIDDYRALHFVEVLSAIRQLGHQVICTVEDPALADLLCRRLRCSELGEGIRVNLCYGPGSGVEIQSLRELTPLPENVLLSA